MDRKFYILLIVSIALICILACADALLSLTQADYALRPVIEITNWGGSVEKIHFPYLDTKYNLNHENPYEFVETEIGYDLVLHFKNKPNDVSIE